MKTWHERLEEALEARGMAWDALVHITGCAKPSVYAWKSRATKRTSMMNGDNAARVCATLGISPLWLFYGEGPSGLERRSETMARDSAETITYSSAARANHDPSEQLLLTAYRAGDETARQLLIAQAEAILGTIQKGAANGN